MSNLLKFMMTIIAITFLMFISANVFVGKHQEVNGKPTILPKHKIAT